MAGHVVALGDMGQPAWTPRDYGNLAKEAYQKNVVAFQSINMVAQGFAQIDWELFRKGRGDRAQLDEHSLLNLVKRPNPMTGGADLFSAWGAFLLIAGNSYLEAVGPDGKEPIELWNLRPDRMKVVPGKTGLPALYRYSLKGRDVDWPVDPFTGQSLVSHWRTFNPLNDWYGMSAIEAAAFSVDQHNSAGQWNQSMLQNRAMVGGALIFKSTDEGGGPAVLSPEQRASLQHQLDTRFAGARNAGRPVLLEGDFDWKEMSLTPKDMDWLKGRDVSARDVALAFGVPPQLVGIPDAATYSNMREARLGLWEETILPLLDKGRDELNNWLVPMFGDDLALEYNADVVPALNMQRQRKFETFGGVDFLTINEKREAVGYEPVDGGDDILVNAGLLPLGFSLGNDDEGQVALASPGGLSYKLLTDRSPGAQAREFAQHTRLQIARARGLARSMIAELRRVARDAAAGYAEGGLSEAMHRTDQHDERVTLALRAHYTTVMDTFGERILDAAKDQGAVETKDAADAFALSRDEWIGTHAAKKVTAISKTTRDQIRNAVAEGEAVAEGTVAVARRITEATGGLIARNRAVLISRTETHSAAVAAGDQAAEATGLQLQREWIAAGDDRTRETHIEANGQVVQLKQPFRVGNGDLMRPGDPSGPPEETINCRCVIGHLTPEEVA